MKVLITSSGADLESQVFPQFDRSPYYLIVETVTMGFETKCIEDSESSNAGIDIALTAIERGVEVVLTGDISDEVHEMLTNAGVTVILNCNGTLHKHLDSLIAHGFDEAQFACV